MIYVSRLKWSDPNVRSIGIEDPKYDAPARREPWRQFTEEQSEVENHTIRSAIEGNHKGNASRDADG
eukprot:1750537-Prymnesium_polylepis.1